MMHARLIPLLLMFCSLALSAHAEVLVVVHPDSPLQALSAKDISDLYLGRGRASGNGERPLVLDQPRDSTLRERFFKQINGMDLRRVNAYWARLQFSGDTLPPVQMADNKAVIDAVRKNRLAIGYIDASTVSDQVRPLLSLKEP